MLASITRNRQHESPITDADLFLAIKEVDSRGRLWLKQYRKSQTSLSRPPASTRVKAGDLAKTESADEAPNGALPACPSALPARTDNRRPGKKKAFRTSSITAQVVGSSPRQVEKVRTILDHAAPCVHEAIAHGQMSIEEGYRIGISERDAKRLASNSVEANQQALTLIEVFRKISRSLVPMESCVRPLELNEKQLLLRLGKELEAAGLLTAVEYRSLEIALFPSNCTKFGGPLNSNERKPE